MANKNLKSIKFPGLTDTYVVPQVDNTLTQENRPADAKKTGDEISALKEDLSQMTAEGTVPTSEQMLSDNYTEDSVPYHFRKTASDNADREELEIVGGSVAWNQLINANSASELFSPNATITASNNTVTLTSSAASGNIVRFGKKNGITSVIGHKVLLSGVVTPSVAGGLRLYNGTSWIAGANITAGTPVSFSVIFDVGTNGFVQDTPFGFTPSANMDSDTITWENPQIYDLTAMFGSTIADHIYALEQATAGAGVNLFRSLFNKDYYPYDAGSIQSVSGLSEHKTVGLNQWDEEWEVGTIKDADGTNITYSQAIRAKNFIPIIPGASYYFKAPSGFDGSGSNSKIYFYREDKTYITVMGGRANVVTRVPDNAHYIRFALNNITTYNHDICINISDPNKNGQYEPYQKHVYALNPNGDLRGYPMLVDGKIKFDGDIYSPSGKVSHKYALIELGSRTWTLDSDSMFQCAVDGGKAKSIKMLFSNGKYTPIAEYNTAYQTDLSAYINSSLLRIKDDSYNDAASFKTAMANVYALFELATPTTEQADPYVSPQICSPYGTEEFVSTGIIPVGHVTKYPDNLRMKLDNLPWNFASLIAPTESGFKATQNYTTGALLIVNNTLYKTTANIANGATITVGTNVTATTLADVIAAMS